MRAILLTTLIFCTCASAEERSKMDELIEAITRETLVDAAVTQDAYIYQERNQALRQYPAPPAPTNNNPHAWINERNYFADALNQADRKYRIEKSLYDAR